MMHRYVATRYSNSMIDYPVYAPVLSSFVDLLIDDGVDKLRIREAIGFDTIESLSTEPVSSSALQRVVALLSDHLQEDDFFLKFRLDNATAPRHFSTWMSDNCATVGELLINMCQYAQLTNIADVVRCEIDAKETRLSYRNLSYDLEQPLLNEYMFSFLVSRIDRLTGGNARPSSLEFYYQEPSYSDVYRSVFNCPVHFGCNQSAVIYSNDATQQTVVGHDPHLFNTLKQQADLQLKNLDSKVLIFDVKSLIIDTLMHADCNADTIASRLHMDKATLNRKLKKLGFSFQKILDNSRYELSRHYHSLGHGAEEVSYRLGFSEVSSYKRALKRWQLDGQL